MNACDVPAARMLRQRAEASSDGDERLDQPGPVLAPGDTDTARFYREILDGLDDQIVRFSICDLTVRYCNPAWAERFGLTPADLIGQPVDGCLEEHERSGLFGSLQRALSEGPAPGGVIADHVRPDGTIRHELWQDHLLENETGETDFLCTAHDITALALARAELTASEARHRRLVEDLGLPAFAISREGIILFANQAGANHLGVAGAEDLIEQSWPDLIHPDDLPRLLESIGDGVAAERAEIRMTDGHGGWWLADGVAVETEFDGVPVALVVQRDVTALAEARDRLAESEERHRRLVHDLPLPAFLASYEGNLLIANTSGARAVGVDDPEELRGVSWATLIHPDDLPRVAETIAGRPSSASMEFRMTDGRGGWWLAETAGVKVVVDDEPVVLIVQRDITSQRAAEIQLAEVERREWLMLNSLAEAVLLHDETGRITFANMRAAELFGESEPEMLLGLHTDTWISDGIDAEGNPLGRAGLVDPVFISGEPRVNLEFQLASIEDPSDVRWLRASAVPIDDLGIDQPSGVVCSITDITAERRAREALEASEARFRGVVENLGEGLLLMGTQGEFLNVNEAAERILGRDRATLETIGLFDPSWTVIDTDGQPVAAEEMPGAITLATGEPIRERVLGVVMPSTMRFRGQPGQDEVRWLSVTTQALDEGELRRVVVLFSDITDRRRAEQALEHQANHDALTGLPNRANLMRRLARVVGGRGPGCTAVMFLDLDRFKPVNDEHGHEAGDELLCAVAGRMSARVREGDTVARVGGDEFVVIARGLDDTDAANALAARLRDDLRRPFRLKAARVSIDASIGVVCADEFDNVDELLAASDAEMYRVKQARPDRGR